MKTVMRRIIIILNIWRIAFAYLLVRALNRKLRILIIDEMYHWKKCAHETERGIWLFGTLLLYYKEYRNLLCYRMKTGGIFGE